MDKLECTAERPFWYDGKFLNEVGFCEDFLQKHPMVCVGGSFFTKNGRITDEESVRKEIYEMLRPFPQLRPCQTGIGTSGNGETGSL